MYQHTARRPGGFIIITSESGPAVEFDTRQCCHCGGHFIVEPGSGTKRGWCYPCGQVTCGREACDRCLPTERLMERIEAKATRAMRGY